jgi:LacI family transcriptional regulator
MSQLTITDIARLAGVSKKTVSKVLNRSDQVSAATGEKVRRVIADNGYVPNPQARALALKRNFLVALIHDGTDKWALIECQAGADRGLGGSEYALVVRRIDHDGPGAAQLADFLAAHRPSAVVLMPALADDPQVLAACAQAKCPAMRLGAQQPGVDALIIAERAAASAAVTTLVALGHRRIAMITGPDESLAAQARELGYLDALADHDLDRGPALVAGGDFSFASGREAGRLLLEVSPRPTAIFAASDAMAAGVIHAALDAGLAVPHDLSVVGFGDGALAERIWPPLASVRMPLADLAEHAVRRLVDPAGTAAVDSAWPADLVRRASLGTAPGSGD